jgi:hypothetical protein
MLELSNEVQPRLFRELVAAGSVSSAVVRSFDKGLLIVLQVGLNERVVGAARGGPRYFQSIDGAASVLQQAGVRTFSVDTTNWTPKTLKVRAATV